MHAADLPAAAAKARARAGRVPADRRRQQHPVPARADRPDRRRRDRPAHPLRRGAHRRARRGSGRARPPAPARPSAERRPARGREDRRGRSAGGAGARQGRGRAGRPAPRPRRRPAGVRRHRRPRGHDAAARAAAGHHRQPGGRGRATRSAPARPCAIMESMKMEHVIAAHVAGYVREITVAARRHRLRGPSAGLHRGGRRRRRRRGRDRGRSTSTHIRPDLAADPRRATPRRSTRRGPTRSRGGARPASAPRARTSTTCSIPAPSSNTARWWSPRAGAATRLEELIDQTPADGLVMGLGRVNGAPWSARTPRAAR